MSVGEPKINENLKRCGVQDFKIENNHYVVSVVWKNGEESVSHFPVNGVDIVNPRTHQRLGFLKGKDVLSILEKHSAEYDREDFSLIPFVKKEI